MACKNTLSQLAGWLSPIQLPTSVTAVLDKLLAESVGDSLHRKALKIVCQHYNRLHVGIQNEKIYYYIQHPAGVDLSDGNKFAGHLNLAFKRLNNVLAKGGKLKRLPECFTVKTNFRPGAENYTYVCILQKEVAHEAK